ncbi:chlorophyll a/b-binding protein [Leptolyngbya iicbica]|uniref:High light inducible protein n=2 Tax=Cyanophyceae TaxID=3028117 RepID=A0A4Q7E9A3_9CYAN|nr:chlorophyll a/b-binding protein [Leptolyngbya sp. LK]RZM78994.1 high light inducible protein [Leptolyngbya sp. LK]
MTADSQDTSTPTSDTPTTEAASATETAEKAPSFGWNTYAERINGRFAMIGFVALLLLELITRQDFFTWLGF